MGDGSNLPFDAAPESGKAMARERVEAIPSTPLRRGYCDWCGKRCRRGRTYCSPACRISYNNLITRQGKALVQSLKVWRLHRGRAGSPGAGMLTRVSERVDALLSEDRKRWAALMSKDEG